MSEIPTWTKEAYPGTIAVVNPHPASDSGYMIIREKDLLPEHELFGPEGKGYPPDHVPPPPAAFDIKNPPASIDIKKPDERMTESELLKGLEPLLPQNETRERKRHHAAKPN